MSERACIYSSIPFLQRAAVLRAAFLFVRMCGDVAACPSDQKLRIFSTFMKISSTCSSSVMSATPPSRSRTSADERTSALKRLKRSSSAYRKSKTRCPQAAATVWQTCPPLC